MKRLKYLREEKGLKQYEVANSINVSVVTYGNWERGKLIPSNSNLKKIADFFDVTPAYLLGYDESPINANKDNHAPNYQNSGSGDITINQHHNNNDYERRLIEYSNKLDTILANQREQIAMLKQLIKELTELKKDASEKQQANIDRLLTMVEKTFK